MSLISRFAQIVLLLCLLLAPAVRAELVHDYHTSLTRIDYNETDNIFEVTIQLLTHDLAPVLARKYGKPFDLELDPEIDSMLLAYITENLTMNDAAEAPMKLHWVGKEVKADALYAYLEIPYTGELKGLSIRNTIFFEMFAEQTNYVSAHF